MMESAVLADGTRAVAAAFAEDQRLGSAVPACSDFRRAAGAVLGERYRDREAAGFRWE